MVDHSRWTEPSRAEGEPLRIAVPARGAPEWYLSALVRRLGETAGLPIESKRFDGGEPRRVAAIHEGMAELCVSLEETVRWAYRAESAYEGWRHTSFRLLAGIEQTQWLAVAARRDARIGSLADLADARDVRVLSHVRGGEETTWAFLVEELLRAHGAAPERLRLVPLEEERSRVRRLDFDLLIAPHGPFRGWRSTIWHEASTLAPLRFLPLDDDALAHLEREHGVRRGELPAGALAGVEEPVPTLRFDRWFLFGSERLAEDDALALARVLEEGRERLLPLHASHDPRRPLLDVGVPVHRAIRADRAARGLETVEAQRLG